MGYKYSKTWSAIDDAISKSHDLKQYPFISRTIGYVRQYPHDRDIVEFNLGCCAGAEMEDDPKAPIWNAVVQVWLAEKKEVALEQSKPARDLARVT